MDSLYSRVGILLTEKLEMKDKKRPRVVNLVDGGWVKFYATSVHSWDGDKRLIVEGKPMEFSQKIKSWGIGAD